MCVPTILESILYLAISDVSVCPEVSYLCLIYRLRIAGIQGIKRVGVFIKT
jgi:hypothetical protein